MALVGIISDTHGSVPDGVHEAFRGVDVIVHAGDICGRGVIFELESIAPLRAVVGNCDHIDYGASVRPTLDTEIAGVRIFVSHFPEDAEAAARSGEYGLAVHGHTHVPRDEVAGGCRVLNPGSATHPRHGSTPGAMLVRLEDGVVGIVRRVEL